LIQAFAQKGNEIGPSFTYLRRSKLEKDPSFIYIRRSNLEKEKIMRKDHDPS
jgi:hypothetical protein